MTEYPKRLNRFPKDVVNKYNPQELQELRILLALPDSIHQLQTSISECVRDTEANLYKERLAENMEQLEELTNKWGISSLDLAPTSPMLVEEVVAFEPEEL